MSETPPGGPPPATAPTVAARRGQAAIDSAAALVIAVLAWPFPLARATLPPLVNVVSIIVLWQLVQVCYCAVTMALWGATAGTRVMGLHVVAEGGGTPTRKQRIVWGLVTGALATAGVVAPPKRGERAAADRAAGVDVQVTPR